MHDTMLIKVASSFCCLCTSSGLLLGSSVNLHLNAAKLVLISNNCPPIRKSEIEYYAMLSKTGVHHYTGSECSLHLPYFASAACSRDHKKQVCLFSLPRNSILYTSQYFLAMSLLLTCCWLADNVELGTACGKLHRVSSMTITDAGE